MQQLRVAAGALLLGFALACSDPVSNPSEELALSSQSVADRSNAEPRGRSFGHAEIEVYDDCDPNDPAWAPTGGCTLRRGSVTEAEFTALLGSPFSQSVVGHPAWRNEPSYLKVKQGKRIRVENEGGRFHTFTEVAQFGGGRVPPLNQGLTMAPECALAPGAVDPNGLAPEGELTIQGLAAGVHRYQCCIHPWMRAMVNVGAGSAR